MTGLEPAWTCSQNKWVNHYPTSRFILVPNLGLEPRVSWLQVKRSTILLIRHIALSRLTTHPFYLPHLFSEDLQFTSLFIYYTLYQPLSHIQWSGSLTGKSVLYESSHFMVGQPWCRRGDLNPQSRRQRFLRPSCIPSSITPAYFIKILFLFSINIIQYFFYFFK